ncbi:hypothetical protein Dsin_017281 [Dipteronia sinensis]|uniref:RNase H type-1 domain-containing protein n=1 Tax=Dipteronia sinensis TaxID=43782 RepID=A0AAE0AG55_9ROSI|nr:hypothetical protein Dsin_017281 [Dipteronia sinensis]
MFRIASGYSAPVAETIAVLRGYQLEVDSGLLPVVVETDAFNVVKQVNLRIISNTEIENVICDIQHLVRSVNVPRKANVVAHGLAQMNMSITEDHFWIQEVRLYMERIVWNDLSD